MYVCAYVCIYLFIINRNLQLRRKSHYRRFCS